MVGNDPETLAFSCDIILRQKPFVSWLNINCGCPSARTMSSGGGSALLHHPGKITEAVRLIKKKVDIPLSVKIRIKTDRTETIRLCQELESAGADFLILHGRTAAQGYSGEADWELIRSVKESLSIPLIGNGDLKNAGDGEERVKRRYCDGFMIARAAMGNPKVFDNRELKDAQERFELLEEYISLYRQYEGEPDLKDIRIKAMNFATGAYGAAALRNAIARARSVEEIKSLPEWREMPG